GGQVIPATGSGAQVPYGAARFGEAALDEAACGIELSACGIDGGAEEAGDELQLHADADDVLREGVVDLARDAGALGEHGVEAQLYVAHAHPVDLIADEQHCETEERAKPPGLPEVREHADFEYGAGVVPHAVVIGGEDVE